MVNPTTEAPTTEAPKPEPKASDPQVTMQKVTVDAMLPGPDTQEEIEIPVGNGPANTRIIQAVFPTPVADEQKPAGTDQSQEKADEENAKGYVGWRPGDPI